MFSNSQPSDKNTKENLTFNAKFYLNKTDIPILMEIYNDLLQIDRDLTLETILRTSFTLNENIFSGLLEKTENKILLSPEEVYQIAILLCKSIIYSRPPGNVFLGGPPEGYASPIISKKQIDIEKRIANESEQLIEKVFGLKYSDALKSLWKKNSFSYLAILTTVSVDPNSASLVSEYVHLLAKEERRCYYEEVNKDYVDFHEYKLILEYVYLGKQKLEKLIECLVSLRDYQMSTSETRQQLVQHYGFIGRFDVYTNELTELQQLNDLVAQVKKHLEWMQICVLIIFQKNNASSQAQQNFFSLMPHILSYFGVSYNVAKTINASKNPHLHRFFSQNFSNNLFSKVITSEQSSNSIELTKQEFFEKKSLSI